MNKIELLKTGVSTVVSVGVGAIVGNAIKSTTPIDATRLAKVFVKIGSFAVTGIVSDLAAKYTEEKIEKTAESIMQAVKEEQNAEEK